MLKNKLFFFYFFIFAFRVESFAMRESNSTGDFNNFFVNDNGERFDNNSSNNRQDNGVLATNNRAGNRLNIDGQGGQKTYPEVSKKKINKPAHIFFYLVLSPFFNVNNLDWRYYFSQGKLNKGGLFFYYGFLNFGLGFNRKTFCDTCSCRIIGVNLFQFLGSFVLYFFVDKCESSINERWNKIGGFLSFLLFNDAYFDDYIKSIDPESIVKDTVHVDYFKQVIFYSFSIFPFLSFLTFDFQLFEYLNFSLNIGSFLFLAVAFFIYTFYTHARKTFGIISKDISSNNNTLEDSKGTD